MQWIETSSYVYLPIIFFIYGMSFLMLGIATAIEQVTIHGQDPKHFLISPTGSLSLFAFIHAIAEFLDMFCILDGGLANSLRVLRLFFISLSFYFLFRFGVSYGRETIESEQKDDTGGFIGTLRKILSRNIFSGDIPKIMLGIWFILILSLLSIKGFGDEWFIDGEVFSRYMLGLPGALMASFSLLSCINIKWSVTKMFQNMASSGFFFYAILSGLIVPRAGFYPASLFNYENFYSTIHVPVQAFRSVCAIFITISLLNFFNPSRGFSTLRYKTILRLLAAVTLPVFVIILFVSYLTAEAFLELSYRENKKIANLTAGKVLSFFRGVEERARYHFFSRLVFPQKASDVLASLVRENEDISGVILSDRGRELIRIEKNPEDSTMDNRGAVDSEGIKEFLKASALDMRDSHFYIKTHYPRDALIAIPLRRGEIDILVNLDKLYDFISSLRIERGWHALILDGRGGLVLPSHKERFGRKEALEHLATVQGAYRDAIVENGVYYNGIRSKIEPTEWTLVIEIPRSEIVSPIFRIFKGLLLGIFIVFLSVFVVAFIFVERVTNQINKIANKVKLIGKGDLDQKLDIQTGDELQILSEEIEKMAGSLKENRKIEERIIQTEKMASLGRLVAGIAHEINNPLGIILGYCQVILRETSSDGRHFEDLKTIEKHSLGSKRIVEELLKFSRPYKKANMAVDINTNIREAIALIPKNFLSDKVDISFKFKLSNSSPKLMGDPDRLHQLFLNLTMNAFDAMKDGGNLEISTSINRAEGAVEVAFSDTGCGIREEDMGSIFDPFFTTKEVGRGTGLGLSVSYGIVKEHGGEIWADSLPGKGATFHITFPLREDNEQ